MTPIPDRYSISTASVPPPSATELPHGFKWEGNSAVREFEVNSQKLKIIVPIPKKELAAQVLAPFTGEKVHHMGEVAIAAGLGKDAVSVSFQRNEAGEFTGLEKRLKDGKTQVLNEKYFDEEKAKAQKLPPGKRQLELDRLDSLKLSLTNIKNIFKNSAFKGSHTAATSKIELQPIAPSDSSETMKAGALRKSLLHQTQTKLANLQKLLKSNDRIAELFGVQLLLILVGIRDKETRKYVVNQVFEFVNKKSAAIGVEKFIDELNQSLEQKGIPKLQVTEKNMDSFKKTEADLKNRKDQFETMFKKHYGEDEFASWVKFRSDNPKASIDDFEKFRNSE